jgi:hypothetical protein
VIAASTTSLIVPPCAARICFRSTRLAVVQVHRRRGPIGPLREIALTVPGHARQLRLEEPHEVRAGGGRPFEHRDRPDVHGHVVVLGVEELGVQRAHPV